MAAIRGDQRRLAELLSKHDRAILDAFMKAIYANRQSVDMVALIAALEQGNTAEAVRLLAMNKSLLFSLDVAMIGAYIDGGQMIAAGAPASAGALGFDGRHPRAEAWAKNHVGNLIEGIQADTLQMTREVIDRQLIAGQNPRAAALDIVGRVNRATGNREGGFLGLTQRQAEYAANARRELQDLDRGYFTRKLRDRRFDGIVRKAMDADKPLTQTDIDRISGRYRARLLKHRGDNIARTESITALRAGRREGVAQAVEQGVIAEDRVTRVWDATMDSRTRPDHMSMDGTKLDGLEGHWILPDGSRLLYPGDPNGPADQVVNCRCYEAFDVDWLKK